MTFFANGDVALYVKDTNAAIIFSNIYYWCLENKNKQKNYFQKDGDKIPRYWTYDTIKSLKEKFYFLSESQIRTSLEKLESKGLIITGNFNKQAYDRTKWYAVTEDGERLVKEDKNDIYLYEKSDKSICENSQMEMRNISNGFAENRKPIPHNIPNNESHNDSDNSTQHYNSTPTDTPCGSEPNPFDDTPEDLTDPFADYVSHTASTHSHKANEVQKKKVVTKGSYPNEHYKTVFNTYMANYKQLIESGRLKPPIPIISLMSVKGTLKKYFDAYGYETILKAVKESVNDDWLIEHGYVFHHIFGERKLVMLINGIKYENKNCESKSAYVQRAKSGLDYDGEW